MSETLCESHEWRYTEHDGATWNECVACGFRELWADGTLIESSNGSESNRLDGWTLGRVDGSETDAYFNEQTDLAHDEYLRESGSET